MSKKNNTIVDALTERPIRFSIKTSSEERVFSLCPPCLGKLELLSRELALLEFDEDALKKEPIKEAMRVCELHADIACKIIAIAVQNGKTELLDEDKIAEDAEWFKWNCGPSEFASIMVSIITQSRFENFITAIRMLQATCALNEERN